jgi:small subunit ribosomal protein S2
VLPRGAAFITDGASQGKNILFVGTKRQAQDAIYEEANRCGMFYVNNRWLGRLADELRDDPQVDQPAEGDRGDARRQLRRDPHEEGAHPPRAGAREALQEPLGIKEMEELPDVLFVIDPKKEAIAVQEAQKLGIPVVGIVDTNCDPDPITYVIPGNDDAIRAIKLFTGKIADAVLEGLHAQEERFIGQDHRRGGGRADAAAFTEGAAGSRAHRRTRTRRGPRSHLRHERAGGRRVSPAGPFRRLEARARALEPANEGNDHGDHHRSHQGAAREDRRGHARLQVRLDGDEGRHGEAEKLLRKKGLAAAAKKAGRTAPRGSSATRYDGGVAALVELNCETDFVAKLEDFGKLAQALASSSHGDAARRHGRRRRRGLKAMPASDFPGAAGGTVGEWLQAFIAKTGENTQVGGSRAWWPRRATA